MTTHRLKMTGSLAILSEPVFVACPLRLDPDGVLLNAHQLASRHLLGSNDSSDRRPCRPSASIDEIEGHSS